MEDRYDLIEEILARLDRVGEAISEGAVAGFELLVRQQYVRGIGFLMASLLLAALAIVIYRWFHQQARVREADDYEPDRNQELYPRELRQTSIITAIPLGLSMLFLYQAAARFLNPGYYAIREILDTFGR